MVTQTQLSLLSNSLQGLDALGPSGDRQRSRIMVVDSAWNAADNNVAACAQHLGVSYAQAISLLANPAIKRLPRTDPRVQAFEQVMRDTDLTPATLPTGTPPSKKDVATETNAMDLAAKGATHGSQALLESLVLSSVTAPEKTKTPNTR